MPDHLASYIKGKEIVRGIKGKAGFDKENKVEQSQFITDYKIEVFFLINSAW